MSLIYSLKMVWLLNLNAKLQGLIELMFIAPNAVYVNVTETQKSLFYSVMVRQPKSHLQHCDCTHFRLRILCRAKEINRYISRGRLEGEEEIHSVVFLSLVPLRGGPSFSKFWISVILCTRIHTQDIGNESGRSKQLNE